MCGIAGVIDLAIDEQTLERMLKSMRHRGPDGNGRFLTEGCCLLHARLAAHSRCVCRGLMKNM